MIWIPTYFRLGFEFNREQNRYVLTECPPGFSRVPALLIVEQRQSDTIRADADLILRGPEKEPPGGPAAIDTQAGAMGKKPKRANKFFTGLLPTGFANVFDGNVLSRGRESKTVRNGVFVRFSPDANRLMLLYFPGYRPYPADRNKFVTELIQRGLL